MKIVSINRRDDIKYMGMATAQMFDEILIRHDENGRGRSNEDRTRG